MTKSDLPEFAAKINAMAALFGREPSDALVAAYWDALEDLTIDAFKAAVRLAIATEKFMPLPASIRDRAPGGELTATESWGKIRALIKKYGWINPTGAKSEMTPAEQIAVSGLGQWVDLCSTDPDQMDHKLRVYRELLAGAQRRVKNEPELIAASSHRIGMRAKELNELMEALVKK